MILNMRVMTEADVDEVLAIEREVQAYPWTRGNFCDALNSGYLCLIADNQGLIADNPGLVAVNAGEIRAYAVLMPGVGEAELLTIAVAAAHQRKGLGGAMLLEMLNIAAARGWQRVFLEVRSSNQSAISLYRRAGFAEVGLRRAYYRNEQGSEDAIVMACDVDFTGEQHG